MKEPFTKDHGHFDDITLLNFKHYFRPNGSEKQSESETENEIKEGEKIEINIIPPPNRPPIETSDSESEKAQKKDEHVIPENDSASENEDDKIEKEIVKEKTEKVEINIIPPPNRPPVETSDSESETAHEKNESVISEKDSASGNENDKIEKEIVEEKTQKSIPPLNTPDTEKSNTKSDLKADADIDLNQKVMGNNDDKQNENVIAQPSTTNVEESEEDEDSFEKVTFEKVKIASKTPR